MVMTEGEFVSHVLAALEIGMTQSSPSDVLFADLGLDSLQMLELVLIVEELGAEISEDDLARAMTLADAYRLYVAAHEAVEERR